MGCKVHFRPIRTPGAIALSLVVQSSQCFLSDTTAITRYFGSY